MKKKQLTNFRVETETEFVYINSVLRHHLNSDLSADYCWNNEHGAWKPLRLFDICAFSANVSKLGIQSPS